MFNNVIRVILFNFTVVSNLFLRETTLHTPTSFSI